MRLSGCLFAFGTLATTSVAAQQVRPVSLFVTTAGVFESNVDHDVTQREAYGGALGLGLMLERSGPHHRLELRYEVAGHRYSSSNRWNRISHTLETAYSVKPASWLRLQAGAEASLKGNSEDRDLGNQYSFKPRIELQPVSSLAFRVTGAYRIKQDASDPGSDATNTYVAFEVREKGAGAELSIGARREFNDSRGSENRYRRMLYSLEVSTPWSARDLLEFSLCYREQRYLHRRVALTDGSVPRRDRRITTGLAYTHRFWSALDVELGYEFEARGSNDARREYTSHEVTLVFRRWF